MNYEAWKARYEARMAQRQRAASTPGVPVPGTGRRTWRRRHGWKMRPYERPRDGGGTSKRNEVHDL